MTYLHVCEKQYLLKREGNKGYLHSIIGDPVSVSCDPQTAEEISSITQVKNSTWKLASGQH